MTVSANYTVKSGDTLAKIAAKNGMTVAELAAKNGIKDVNKIIIGQELVINDGEGLTVEAEPTMSEADFEARFKQQQEEINKLKNRTLAQQAKEEIVDVTTKAAKAVAGAVADGTEYVVDTNVKTAKAVAKAVVDGTKYVVDTNIKAAKAAAGAVVDGTKYVVDTNIKAAKAAAGAVVDGTKYVVETNVETAKATAKAVADGTKYVVDTNIKAAKAAAGAVADGTKYVVETNVKAAKATAKAVVAGHNAIVGAEEDAARYVADKGKKAAKAAKNAMKFDIAPEKEEKAPDFSKMTKEEILDYQQQQIEALKNESLSDKAKKEIKAKIRAAQSAHNAIVDGAYNVAKGAYHTAADAAKKVLGWLKW